MKTVFSVKLRMGRFHHPQFMRTMIFGSASKGHALILPKQHYKDICEADMAVTGKILPLAAKIGSAMKKRLGASGFNVVQNNGTSAGQTVFHLHVHVIPRYENGPVMVAWNPGKAESRELEETAGILKNALAEELFTEEK